MDDKTILDLLKRQEEKLENIENQLQLQKEVLNIDELCEFTGLSKSTIYKKTHNGTIPFYKQSGFLYFDKAEVIAWLNSVKGFNSLETSHDAATYCAFGKKEGNHAS